MTASPQIIIEVTGEPSSTPGVYRIFEYSKIASSAPVVTMSVLNASGITSYYWELVSIPEGSTAVLNNPTIASPSFLATQGIAGPYLIRCTINSGQSIGTNAIAFLTLNYSLRKFAYLETVEFGAEGWTTALNDIIDAIEGISGGGGGGGSADNILRTGTVAYIANQPMNNHKLTGLSAGTTNGDSVRYNEFHAVDLLVIDAVADIASLDGRLTTAEGDITTIEGDVTTLEGTVVSLGATITAIALLIQGMTEAADEVTGFEETERTNSAISFVDGTRIFTVQPQTPATSFRYWYHGQQATISAPVTVTIPDVGGFYLVYFSDLAGTLTYTKYTYSSDRLIDVHCLVAVLYWDALNNKCLSLCDGRFDVKMDNATQQEFLMKVGIRCTPATAGNCAVEPQTPDGDGSNNDHCRISINKGGHRIQDLPYYHSSYLPASLTVYYVEEVTSENTWAYDAASDYPVKSFGSGRLAYNKRTPDQFDGGMYSQEEVTEGYFILSHIFFTGDLSRPYIAVQGRNQYATQDAAERNAAKEINDILKTMLEPSTFLFEGLPFWTYMAHASILFQTSSSYSNTKKARTISVTSNYTDASFLPCFDWRYKQLNGCSTAILDFVTKGELEGLTAHTHPYTEVITPALGGATGLESAREWFDVGYSSFAQNGFDTDNEDPTGGTINVLSGECSIRVTNSISANLYSVAFPTVTGIALTKSDTVVGAINWIFADYNGGSPTVDITVGAPPTDYDKVILYCIVWITGSMQVYDMRAIGKDVPWQYQIAHATQGWKASPQQAILTFGDGVNPTIAVTAGLLVNGLYRLTVQPFDSSGTDDFTICYGYDETDYTYDDAQTELLVDKYDDGSATPASLTTDYYGIHWVYYIPATIDGLPKIFVVLGRGNYATEAEAMSVKELLWIDLPVFCRYPGLGVLLGRIVVKNGAIVGKVTQPWDQFPPQPDAAAGSPGTSVSEYVVFEDQENAGVDAGVNGSGSWNTRVFNTTFNPESYTWVARTGNVFNLAVGKYLVRASAPAVAVGRHQLRFRQTTATAATILIGQSMNSAYFAEEDTSMAHVEGIFEVSSSAKDYELQHWTERAVIGYGLGKAASRTASDGPGEKEVYARIVIQKIG